jgi:hypothetical protein
LQHKGASAPADEQPAWRLWDRWISEIVADLWSIGKLGVGSTLGLMGVVSLPRWAVFRIGTDDPHPAPWIRVRLSCKLGERLYPDPQWQRLSRLWEELYPRTDLDEERRALLDALEATIPQLVEVLVEHRPLRLGGLSLPEVLPLRERQPAQLAAYHLAWQGRHEHLREAPPSLALAVLGQARLRDELTPELESRIVSNLLTYWAMRSTLDIAEICNLPALPRTTRRPARERAIAHQRQPILSP